jgi:molecular chaperone GrpE (heat shock protein)
MLAKAMRHEAVATVRDFAGTPGTVVDEAGRGYLWNDELLRAARGRVAEEVAASSV